MKEGEVRKILDWVRNENYKALNIYFSRMLDNVIEKEPYRAKNFREKFKNELIEKQTDEERLLKEYLSECGIYYEFQKIINYYEKDLRKFYIVDFFITDAHIVIEVDGGYHNDVDVYNNDLKRTMILKTLGIKEVYRFTNYEVNKFPDKVKEKLLEIKELYKL